jgi:hypothetical protein
MSDIIERTEAALRADCAGRRDLVLELLDALKAERARNTDRDAYTSELVEKIRGLSIDLNTAAYHLNARSQDLSAVFPPIPRG